MAASTSRAILTRNSSQTRLGLACSSAASSKSSPVSPSIHFLIDFNSPQNASPWSLSNIAGLVWASVSQSNFTNLLLIQPRSDEYGSVFGRACSRTCTSYQLLSALSTFTFEPDSARPIGTFCVLATGLKLTSVVVTPSRPIIKVSLNCGTLVSGFQCEVMYLWVAT